MQRNIQERNVFQPGELQVLKSALHRVKTRLEEQYGSFGPKTETLQLVSAAAMFKLAQTGNLETDDLVDAGAESVRVFLTWASARPEGRGRSVSQ